MRQILMDSYSQSIPQDDGFMDCWIIGFEFKENHKYCILGKISEQAFRIFPIC
jgi:hypothetical protein